MSKQARMFKDLLELSEKMFNQVIAVYESYPESYTQDEITVIQAMLALAED